MTRITHVFRILTAAAGLAAVPAQAQEIVPPLVEVGALGSGMVAASFEGGGTGLGGGGAIVSVNPFRRLRIDLLGEVVGPSGVGGFSGLYQIQARVPLHTWRDGRETLSFTFGTGGLYSSQRFREYRLTRPDGSIVVTPGYRRSRLDAPRMVTAGVAHQRVLTSRTSMILGAQTIFAEGAIVLRGSAGFVVGLGKYQ
jgi:hypothetical protein